MSPQVNSHKQEEKEDPDERKSFWGIRCEGGKGYSRVLSRRCNMTMAALEPNTSKAENPWLSLMMERDGSQFLLCSLKHDAIMQVPLKLIFEKGEKIKFYVKGQGTVHLSGYQEGSSADTEVIETDQKGVVEEDYSTIGKAIKNGQIFCEVCDTFIKSEPFWKKHIQKKKHIKNLKSGKFDSSSCSPKNIKNNPSPSNAVSPDDEASSGIEEIPSNMPSGSSNMPSGSSGKAGSSGAPVKQYLSNNLIKVLGHVSDDDEDDEEDKDFNIFDEEDEEDEDSDDDEVEEEEDDDDDSDDSGGMVNKALEAQKRKREAEALNSRKRVKKNNSIPEASTSEAVEILEVEDDDEEEDDSSPEEDSDDSDENESPPFKKSPLIKNAQASNKKKKSNDSVHPIDSNSKPNSDKGDSLFEVQDLRSGYGPPAKAGKMVQVFYTGKFLDGKIFDQTKGKPFSFKLGAGEVIKGWDMGVEGMKVGGKRKMKIPPHLAYGNKEEDGIPANSTLVFVVELKSIS